MQQRTGNTPPPKKKARASLPGLQPPKSRPFAGVTGDNSPARDTKIPNLTEHVKIAKARKEALQHGGLASPATQKAASEAGKALAAHKQAKRSVTIPNRPPQKPSKPLARKPAGLSTPLILGAPPAPPKSAPALVSPPPIPSERRGTINPRAGMAAAEAAKPKGQLLPALKGPALGRYAKPVGHAIDLGLGTTAATALAGVGIGDPSILTAKVNAPGALKTTSQAAGQLAGAGLSLPKTIPSVDLVPAAGAASATTMSPEKLVAAGLSEKQTALFRKRALKQGWYGQEIDGLVGLDLIKHAYSKPPPLPLRVLQNFGAGVIRTGALANVAPALGQEFASGHGLRAVKEFGDVAAKQFGGMISHPGEAAVSDPYAFVPVAGGTLKTLGGIGGKVAEKAGAKAVERDVALASTGAIVNRGTRSRNLYTASGQALADKAASQFPGVARKVESKAVDKLVADVSNETAPLHHGVQVAYAKAFKKVGPKRAELLSSINKAGGKPEKVLAKYAADGNARQVKHWTQVVEASKNLSEKDHAFLAAHKELGAQTTATHVTLGRFSDTAGIYRAHQPLILSDAHAGDPEASRVQALHDEWVTTLRKTDDPAVLDPMFGAYDHAVREYAQRHLDAGGFEPTRVAYTPPLPSPAQTSRYRKGTGGRVRFNARNPKQPPSTGASFESGNYLIDPKVALRENLQAQRLRTSIGLTSDKSMQSIGAIPHEQGVLIPKGYTFTPKQNPATVGKVISDLHDQPVGAHDYYHQEASIRDRFASSLNHDKQGPGEYSKTEGWLVPTGSFERILDYTRPESRSAYDRAIRQYSRVLISTSPSTIVGNTAGSVPLALAAGAVTPGPWKKAFESSRDATLVPHSIHGRGVAGNLAADARNPLTAGMNKMRAASVKGEDFSRDAAYFSQALKGANKRAKELDYPDTNAYLRDMATGKVDQHVRDAAIAHAIQFAGDAAKPMTKVGKHLSRVVLFPQWLQHMTKLMLFTLPVHHPRRMALINALAAYGDQYRKEHGALPTWMQAFLPILKHHIGNQAFNLVGGLGQFTPTGTAGNAFDQLSGYQSFPERLLGLTNPVVQAAVNSAVVQPIKNYANPDKAVNLGQYAQNQFLYTIPNMSKVFPRTGFKSTSRPWDPQEKTYSYKDPDGNTVTVPWHMRPGARPVGGLLGIASRFGGLPLYEVPAPESAINKRDVATQIWWAKHPNGIQS